MRLLLDTHALLWMLDDSPELSANARAAIANPGHEKWLSIASLWEITIKRSLSKLPHIPSLPELFALLRGNALIHHIAVEPTHLLRLVELPYHHRDPFDRMLIAQALCEEFTVVSRDGKMDAYGVARLW